MSGLTLAPSAERDLETIWHYFAVEQDRRQTALRQIQRLRDVFALLALHPELGQARDHLTDGIQAFVRHPYAVLYRIDATGVRIMQVVHGSRDL